MSLPDIDEHFEIYDRISMAELWEFLKATAPKYAEAEQWLNVHVTTEELDRLDAQIAYYFGFIIKPLAQNIFVEGRKYSPESWHELLKGMFLPFREIELPNRTVVKVRSSLARGKISNKAMAKYTLECAAYATSEHGIIIEDKAP